MRRIFLLTLAFMLLAVPLASAQTFTVAITGAPAEFPTLASNSTATATFKVAVTMSGAVCPTATTIPVTLTATAGGAPAFFTVAPEPAEFTINVPAGAYAGPPGPSFSGSADAGVIGTTTVITANASVPVTLSATAQPPADCQSQGLSPATSETVTVFANLTAPPPPPPPTPEPEEKGFLPGPGAFMGTLAAVIAVALRRGARRS